MADRVLHKARDYGIQHVTEPIDPYQHAPSEPHEGPPNPEPDVFTELAQIPSALWEMRNELHNLYGLLLGQLSPRPFANAATLSNTAGTQLGALTQAWAAAFTLTRDSGAELVDILIGTDAAQTVQLLKVNSVQLDPQIATTVLATVRTVANQLTVPVPVPVRLEQGESLILLCTSASAVHFDFSCRYRYPRT